MWFHRKRMDTIREDGDHLGNAALPLQPRLHLPSALLLASPEVETP